MCRKCDSYQGHHQPTSFSHRNIKFYLLFIVIMGKKIGLFWLRDDFRTAKNFGLYEATRNHDEVVVFYLYKESNYLNQEAQKWWLSKSLLNFKKKLDSLQNL